MTTKDYMAVAEMIRQRREEIKSDYATLTNHDDTEHMPYIVRMLEVNGFARRMAGLFKQDNTRFDRDEFMRACGLDN